MSEIFKIFEKIIFQKIFRKIFVNHFNYFFYLVLQKYNCNFFFQFRRLNLNPQPLGWKNSDLTSQLYHCLFQPGESASYVYCFTHTSYLLCAHKYNGRVKCNLTQQIHFFSFWGCIPVRKGKDRRHNVSQYCIDFWLYYSDKTLRCLHILC